jgi:capsular polysaccharide biosynthesis protein
MSPVVSECGSSRKDSCTIRALSVSVSRAGPRSLVSSRVGTRRVASFDDVAGASTIDLDVPSSGPGPAARRVAILENCRLATGGGVVVTSDGAIVMESLWDDEHYHREFRHRRVRLRPPTPLDGEHASLVSLWCDNYYHWMVDALPRLASLQAAGLDAVPLVVPYRRSRFQRESLALLGLPARRLTAFVNEHVAPRTLIWAPAPAHIGYPSTFVVAWLRRALGQGTRERGRRLYVARSGSRRVVNEDRVVELLRRHGFEVIHPERMALAEQIRAFEAAEAVVAPHGAGLTNIAFSERLALLELMPPTYVNPCYHQLARAAGHDHRQLVGEEVSSRRPPRERPFAVPIDALATAIRGMLAG